MITAFVQFALPKPITLERAKELFSGTAPKYQKVDGLLRKYYVLSEDGGTAGGVYLWRSKVDAKRLYTNEWKNFIKDRYGATPTIEYFSSRVVVDNVHQEIITD